MFQNHSWNIKLEQHKVFPTFTEQAMGQLSWELGENDCIVYNELYVFQKEKKCLF